MADDDHTDDGERDEKDPDAHTKKTLRGPAVNDELDQIKDTGHLSNIGEARGYIEEFLDHEFLDDLVAVLQGTEKLTNKTWRVVVTSKGVEIKVVEGAAIMGKDKDES